MDALSEIINWAKTLPKWQQLVAKHILDGTKIDSSIIDEILAVALGDKEVKDDLLDGHTYNGKTIAKVSLTNITELNNINNLKDGESLGFHTTGLTVIYGSNGAGKSGYSRILKKCCRSRDKKNEILGNVHNPGKKEQSAKINFRVDDSEKTHVWNKLDTDISTELQSVHVFDRMSGDVFLTKDADIHYKPSGMDILDRLIEVLKTVDVRLQERNAGLEISDLESIFQNEYGATEATKLVGNLGVSDVQEQYDVLSQLSEAELSAMKVLSESISKRDASSPAKEREKLNKLNDSLRNVYNYYSTLLSLLTTEKIKTLNLKLDEVKTARENAENAKKLTFNSDRFLTGTGNEAWKIMWRAAERFSKESAYIDSEFPPKDEGSKCVLCQQVLDSEHAGFMIQFGEYINNESQKVLAQRQSLVMAEINQIRGLLKKPEDEDVLLKSVEADYQDIYKELVVQLPDIRNAVLDMITALENITIVEVASEGIESRDKLETDIRALLSANATELNKPLDDAEFRAQLDGDKAKLNNFKARLALKKYEIAILKNINLLPLRNKLEAIKKQCGTFNISNKISELSKKYIIDTLRTAFNDELKVLTNNKIEAKLISAATKQGVPHSKIVLQL